MITNTNKIEFFSEKGKTNVDNQLAVEIDRFDINSSVTFFCKNKAIFSMSLDEVKCFVEALLKMNSIKINEIKNKDKDKK